MLEDIEKLFPDNRQQNTHHSILRQAQLVDLRILKIVDYICKKHNIQYWLDGGTLLGAVRHKGFIPWDDDVDIAMTREDYNKFLEVAPKEVPEDIFIQNLETTRFAGNTWTQIKDRKSRLLLDRNAEYHQGIYMDIFPCDSYSDNKFRRDFFEKICKSMYIKIQAINAPLKKPYLKRANLLKNITKILLKIVFFVFAIFNNEVIYKLNLKTRKNRILKMGKNPKTNYGYGTDVLNWDKVFKAEAIFPLKKISFEDYEFNCPNDYDYYLETLYGSDYMELPPIEKRVFHNLEIEPVLDEHQQKVLNEGFYSA